MTSDGRDHLDAAVALYKEAGADAAALEKDVRDRVERETGERPSGFQFIVGTIIAIATGGGALKTIAAVRGLVASLSKARAAFKVVSTAIAATDDGKASPAMKAKIKEKLALTNELNEEELELLRLAALKAAA